MPSVLLSIIRIALVVGSPTSSNSWFGNVLIIFSLITLPLSTILSQKIINTYSSLITTIFTFWFGTMLLIPFLIIFYGMPPTNLDTQVWVLLIIQGILCTSCAYLFWNYGLQQISMAKAGVYANIEPIAGVIFRLQLEEQSLLLLLCLFHLSICINLKLRRNEIKPYRFKQPVK